MRNGLQVCVRRGSRSGGCVRGTPTVGGLGSVSSTTDEAVDFVFCWLCGGDYGGGLLVGLWSSVIMDLGREMNWLDLWSEVDC